MKKISAIFIIISIITSTFDIIDTSDILLCGDAVFSSNLENDSDDVDNINISSNHNSHIGGIYMYFPLHAEFISSIVNSSYIPISKQNFTDKIFIKEDIKPPISIA